MPSLTSRGRTHRFARFVADWLVEHARAEPNPADDHGDTLAIPIDATTNAITPGALVAVDTERLGGGAAAMWIRPAFASDDDPNARQPSGVRLVARRSP